MYYFLNGYTAKIAGTEKGIHEPQASFETAFGAPFLTLSPEVYAELLRRKIAQHGTKVWLVNTGWTGGAAGVGKRIPIAYTRAMVRAALEGELEGVTTIRHPIFGLQMPISIEGVPSSVLNPRDSWEDQYAYDVQARKLAKMFVKNFVQFESGVSDLVKNSMPKS